MGDKSEEKSPMMRKLETGIMMRVMRNLENLRLKSPKKEGFKGVGGGATSAFNLSDFISDYEIKKEASRNTNTMTRLKLLKSNKPPI